MKKLALILFFILSSFSSIASNLNNVETFGHNLSHTDRNLPDNSCTAGIQIVACGNKDFLIGTSPFLFEGYNMMNLYIRANIKRGKKVNHSLELALFDTYDENIDNYKMKAVWGYYITTFKVSNNYKMHLNTILGYYMDDTYPFSLRRPTIKKSPYQLNISTLHEGILSEHISLLGELGIIHLTDTYPRLHTGFSLVFKSKQMLVQVGLSMSSTFYALDPDANSFSRHDYQRELISTYKGYNSQIDPEKVKYDFSIHPEISFQLYF